MPFLIPAAIVTAIEGAVTAVAVEATSLALSVGLSAGIAAGIGNVVLFALPALVEFGAVAGVSALISPHPSINNAGSPQQFKPDPNAGVPVVMGRYGVGGNLVYETTSGGANKTEAGARGNEYLTSFVILGGLGPYQAFETLRFNDTILTFDPTGQACNGGYIPQDEVQFWNPGYRHQNDNGSYINNNYQDRAWQNLQLGALDAGYFSPPSKLASDNAGLPEWTQAHGFSSFCAASLTLVYDQRYYAGGVPQPQWVLQGQKLYDPRKDSTYPGGAGPHRWAGEGASAAQIIAARATWEFTQNPDIHALNYALGHFLPDNQTGPGRLYAGIGAGTAGVDIAAFVAAANVADANTWLICGQWNTSDGKWSVLTEMLKAGSATPVIDRGVISCIVDTPLTALGTVTADDLSGPITLPTGASFAARLNTVFPRYTSEAHRWQMVQADTPVKAATYVAEDGAVRSKTIDWQYVPAVNQACQLAAYTITNGREIPGIQLPGKPKLRNYKVGDCFTLAVDEAGLATTKVMVTKRVTDQATGGVTLTVRTETDAKHAYSLGVSGVAPPTPGISGYDPTIVEAPLPDFWATAALQVSDAATNESRYVVRVSGSAADNVYAQTVVLRWRAVALVNGVYTPTGDGSWSYRSFPASQGQFDLDLNPGAYDVQIAYITVNGAYPAADADYLDLGVETVGGSVASNTANVGSQTALEVNTAAAQAATAIAAQASLIAAVQTSINSANAQIAALTTTYGDTASAAASAATAAAAQQATQAAEATALTYQNGAQSAQAGAGTFAGQAQGYAAAASASLTAVQVLAGTTATSASTAQTASSTATAAAAAAQQSYTLAATVGSGALNSNPTFASYAGTGSLPSGWSDGGNAVAASSIKQGFDSPNAIQFDCTGSYSGSGVTLQQLPGGAGANYGLSFAGPGWYVLEVDIYCHSQADVRSAAAFVLAYPQGGGVGSATIPLIVTLQQTADINAVTGAVAGRRQYAVLGYIAAAGSLGLEIQANGAHGVTASSNNEWHKCLLRPASSAEVAGQQALTTANANTATLSSFQSTQVSQNSAFTTSISTLNAAVFTAAGGSLQSQISAVSSAQATQQSTFASQITVLQSQVAIQANMIPNGGFAAGASGWTTYGPTAPYYSATYGMQTLHITGLSASGLAAIGPAFAVSAGVQYTIAASFGADVYSGSGTVTSALVATFYDSSGAQIAGSDRGTPSANYQFKSTGPSAQATITAPAGAATARVYLAITITGSPLVEVYLGRVKGEPGTVYSGWSDDASNLTLTASVNATAATVATLAGQLYASYTLTATAGNVITGLQLLSASGATTVSAVIFQAENLLIKSSAASSAFSPFAYDSTTGTLTLQNLVVTNAVIGTAAIGTMNLVGGAVTSLVYGLSNAVISISSTGSPPPAYTPPGTGSGGGGSGSGGARHQLQ